MEKSQEIFIREIFNCRYTKNEEAIEAHILEIGKQVSAIEGEVRGKRHEHSLVAKDYSRCITEISGLESIQEQCKM